jgi:putative addiction module component (TIGR02574 family)
MGSSALIMATNDGAWYDGSMEAGNMSEKFDHLSIEDRLALIEAIWDSISAHPEQIPLTEAQQQELDRRLEAHSADPTKVTPWDVVRAEALARMRK